MICHLKLEILESIQELHHVGPLHNLRKTVKKCLILWFFWQCHLLKTSSSQKFWILKWRVNILQGMKRKKWRCISLNTKEKTTTTTQDGAMWEEKKRCIICYVQELNHIKTTRPTRQTVVLQLENSNKRGVKKGGPNPGYFHTLDL